MPRLYLDDIIEFQPHLGRARIVTITGLGQDGFTGVLTANKTEKALGRYDQVLRVMRRSNPDVDHKTKTVVVGDTHVGWICTCGHNQIANGDDTEGAMRESRIQQERHRQEVRSDDDS